MSFSNFCSSSHRHYVNILQGVKKTKVSKSAVGMAPADSLPTQALTQQCSLSACLPRESISVAFVGWHLSMRAAKRIVTAMAQDRVMILWHSIWYAVGVQHEWIILVLLGVAPSDMRLSADHYQGCYVSSAVLAPSRSALGCHFLL